MKFFFISRVGWEFLVGEADHIGLPVRALWHHAPNDHYFEVTLTKEET